MTEKKSLFNEYEAYTPEGGELSDKLYHILSDIVKEWSVKGYSIREIESIAMDNITMVAAFQRGIKGVRMRKECRGKRFSVEVAVVFTDNTWESTFTEVEDFPERMAESVAEDKVLEDFSNHPTKTVSFVKTVHIEEIE